MILWLLIILETITIVWLGLEVWKKALEVKEKNERIDSLSQVILGERSPSCTEIGHDWGKIRTVAIGRYTYFTGDIYFKMTERGGLKWAGLECIGRILEETPSDIENKHLVELKACKRCHTFGHTNSAELALLPLIPSANDVYYHKLRPEEAAKPEDADE